MHCTATYVISIAHCPALLWIGQKTKAIRNIKPYPQVCIRARNSKLLLDGSSSRNFIIPNIWCTSIQCLPLPKIRLQSCTQLLICNISQQIGIIHFKSGSDISRRDISSECSRSLPVISYKDKLIASDFTNLTRSLHNYRSRSLACTPLRAPHSDRNPAHWLFLTELSHT